MTIFSSSLCSKNSVDRQLGMFLILLFGTSVRFLYSLRRNWSSFRNSYFLPNVELNFGSFISSPISVSWLILLFTFSSGKMNPDSLLILLEAANQVRDFYSEQCCGSRKIYSGSGYEFLSFRILITVFNQIWNLLKKISAIFYFTL